VYLLLAPHVGERGGAAGRSIDPAAAGATLTTWSYAGRRVAASRRNGEIARRCRSSGMRIPTRFGGCVPDGHVRPRCAIPAVVRLAAATARRDVRLSA
jgi:hypothetical protein